MTQYLITPAMENRLPEINLIIDHCVMGWNLPERVKRLSLASYHYQAHDLGQMNIFTAQTTGSGIIGISALETANPLDLPDGKEGLLLHGIFVSPNWQGKGVGREMVAHALDIVRGNHQQGLLVKAQVDANPFFDALGFQRMSVTNTNRDYPHRWWKNTRPKTNSYCSDSP